MLKKKEVFIGNIEKNNIFICPYCKQELSVYDNIIKCDNNHCFDVGKKGEIFLIKTSNYKESNIYNKELFIHRRSFINNNFYSDVYKKISDIINSQNKNNIRILDLGCGEGTHSNKIQKLLNNNSVIIGIDYSKSAISMATDYLYDNNLFIVADTNNIPIKDNSIDIIIDFLSPYNSEEIKRVLKDDGLFIKVSPGPKYLKELKNTEYEKEQEIRDNIQKTFKIIDTFNIVNTFSINCDMLNDLINMTPVSNEKLNDLVKDITIDLNVYVITK